MMSEKRYKFGIIKGSRQAHIVDCHTCKSATIDVYDDNIKYFVDKLNEQQSKITELEKNFEDLVNWSTEISKRNVLLDEKIGRLQQENKELKNKLNKHL